MYTSSKTNSNQVKHQKFDLRSPIVVRALSVKNLLTMTLVLASHKILIHPENIKLQITTA